MSVTLIGATGALQSLNDGMVAQGYTPSAGLGGRAWRRQSAGRTVTVSLLRRTRTVYYGEVRRTRLIGFSLGCGCSTTVQSRLVWWAPLGLVRAWPVRWLNRRKGMHLMEFPADLPPGRGLLAWEPAWAARVVHSPALEVVAALLGESDARGCVGSLTLMPGRWEATAPIAPLASITPESVAQRVNTLVELAALVEALPPPEHPASTTAMERRVQAHPVLFAMGLLCTAAAVVGLCGLAVFVGVLWLLH